MTSNELTRRGVLAGAAAIGVASTLVGCGDDAPSGTAPTDAAGATVKVADVPVGGGVIVGNVVVSQPSAGQYKAFSAICTHQGCIVSKVQANKITCPCHQSVFSAADGSVLEGQATRPLGAKTVTVNGDTLTVA